MIKWTVITALAAAIVSPAEPAVGRPRDVTVASGVRIHVLDEGTERPEVPSLVLIPGWRFPATIWARQIARFHRERRVIAVDSRSQGGSSKVADGNTPEQRAQDLHDVLSRLGVRRVVLVGWSQGVQDVAAYVDRYGAADLAGVVLVDSTISGGAAAAGTSPAAAVRTLQTVRDYTEEPRAFTRGMLDAIITRGMTAHEKDGLVDEMLKTPTAIGASMLVADLLGTDRREAITRFDRHTLIIASARSWERSEQEAMSRAIPGSRFTAVENAGHTVFVDQPEVFNQLLSSFLEGRVTPSP